MMFASGATQKQQQTASFHTGDADARRPKRAVAVTEARRRATRLALAYIVRLAELARFYRLGLGRDAPDEIFGEAVAWIIRMSV
jgi:hypothetical protein